MENPESFEDAVMVYSHDSVWEAWLLTQSNLRNGGEHTHLCDPAPKSCLVETAMLQVIPQFMFWSLSLPE
jgi:hypothetical protein